MGRFAIMAWVALCVSCVFTGAGAAAHAAPPLRVSDTPAPPLRVPDTPAPPLRASDTPAPPLRASDTPAPPLRVPDTIAQRAAACTTCHGEEGRATPDGYFPRIAGKPAGYLHNQLIHFRDGRRNYPLMVYLVEHLTDDYLGEIAAYFAGLDLPYPPPQPSKTPAALLARGEALVRQGDAARQVPACAQCHGAALTGVNPAIPGLLGLSRDYLYGQLGFWKTGERRALAPDCMAKIAAQLTPEDVAAVSAWLAAQPAPANAKPAAQRAKPMPLECGGVPK